MLIRHLCIPAELDFELSGIFFQDLGVRNRMFSLMLRARMGQKRLVR